MSHRFTFLIGLILLLYPFIKVFSEWKMWAVFGIGVVLVVVSLYGAIRTGKGGANTSAKK